MANKANLKFYLTSSEPNLLNVQPSQSLGGYVSLTPYSVSALLSENLNLTDDGIIVDGSIDGVYAVAIGEEIMKLNQTVDLDSDYGNENMLTVTRKSFGTNARFHSAGDLLYASPKNALFNGSLNKSSKQYRCIAIKNTSATDTFKSLQFYIKSPSKNVKSLVRIAVESPVTSVVHSTATSGTTISITDSSLIGLDDNYFAGRVLVIEDTASLNQNQSRVVAASDKRTGTVTFKDSMAYVNKAGTKYRIEQPASQKIVSGRVLPVAGVSNVSPFSYAQGIANAIPINVGGLRDSGDDLKPFETIYLWFERDVSSNTDKYVDNSVVFTAIYSSI